MNDKPNQIRTINFNNLKIGGETSFPIFKHIYVLNIPIFNPDENFEIVKNYYQTNSPQEIIQKAQNSEADILGLKFNIEKAEQIPKAAELLKNLLPYIKKPLMIQGINNNSIDIKLLPELIKILKAPAIIAFANDNTYKKIVPEVVKGNHILVLRSPIDINLAKELNILSNDMGLDLNKILIDTDIGGLGYGLEYGYSIMEKIKLEGLNGDKYLNMPMISFACEESLKTKEAKTSNFSESFGNLKDRAVFFELSSASAVKAAGADVVVMNYPPNISTMKGLE